MDLIDRQAAIKNAHLPVIDDAGYEVVRVDDILALPSAQQWIPCDERLPDGGGKYLISVIDGIRHITTVAKYQPRYKTWDMTGKRSHWRVIAWMPLPEPYREEEAQDAEQ